jgi:hypothetical protein
MDTAQLPGGSSLSFTREIREERKEFLRAAGFCVAEQPEERFLAWAAQTVVCTAR